MERPEDFLGPGASFCSSGLSLVYGFRGGLSLAGSEVEGEGGSGVAGDASSGLELCVRDLVADISVGLREQSEDFLRSGALFCSSSLGLIGSFWAVLSLTGLEVE